MKRANILHRAASILEDQVERMAEILMWEIAKDKKSCISEIERTATLLDILQMQVKI